MTPKPPLVKLVSSKQLFCASPSSEGLIKLLDDICTGKQSITSEDVIELERVSLSRFSFDSKSFFSFDKQIWERLANSGVTIDPYNTQLIFEEQKLTEENLSPNHVDMKPFRTSPEFNEYDHDLLTAKTELQAAGYQMATLISRRQDEIQDTRDNTENQLAFFSQINQLFIKDEQFSNFVKKSKELEDYLIKLCVDPQVKSYRWGKGSEPTNARLDQKHLRWLTQSIISCYIVNLKHQLQGSEFSPVPHAGEFLVSICHTFLLGSTSCLNGAPPDPNLIVQLLAIDTPEFKILWPQYLLSPLIKAPKDLSGICDFITACTVIFPFRHFSSRNSWQFAFRAMQQGCFEEETGHLFYSLTRALVALALDLDVPVLGLIENTENSIEMDENRLSKYVGKHNGFGEILDVAFCCEILRETRDFDEFDQVDTIITPVAGRLKKLCDQKFEILGYPTLIPFVSDVQQLFATDVFIRKRSIFYESISTLAINLADCDEYSDNFDIGRNDTAFLTAARCIAQAGLREHAAVFLGYAFFRSHVFFNSEEFRWSVKELDKFVRDELSRHLIQLYLMPVLKLLIALSRGRSVTWMHDDFRMWIGSLENEYGLNAGTTLRLIPGGLSQQGLDIPVWFGIPSEDLKHHSGNLRRALDGKQHSDSSWQVAKVKYRVKDAVGELQRQLEAEIVDWFCPAYSFFYRNKGFEDTFNRLAPNKLFGTGSKPSLGWVRLFLSNVVGIIEKKAATAEWQSLLCMAEDVMGLRILLENMEGKKAFIQDFKKYCEIDNKKTSHHSSSRENRIRRTDGTSVTISDQLTYTEADWIYKYFFVDFRNLYNCVKPIIKSDIS